MNWNTGVLPKLELSLSNGYSWRSPIMLIYHQVQGFCIADLRADDNMAHKWWCEKGTGATFALEDVLGWLPLRGMTAFPPDRTAPWLLNPDNQRLLDISRKGTDYARDALP